MINQGRILQAVKRERRQINAEGKKKEIAD